MASHRRAWARSITAAALLSGLSAAAMADDSLCPGLAQALQAPPGSGDREVFFSNYTRHWSPSEAHHRVHAVSLRQGLVDRNFCGMSLFTNSFGQPSLYVFVGKTFPDIVPSIPKLFASVSAGLLYGYTYPYENKVPLNFHGFSPAVVPTLGYQLTPDIALETQWLGFAAVMVGASWRY
ncbi:hypothetical protein [Hydrogenophaga sp. PAMC20947]|uniref:hypothetical protein n=1 Tax=Hydrogenophaga sp. PAMC20947 TaxID=2565558 RepID=UPI00109DE6BB|nr:hypothetical protein [Hydrogenophaga sp. PAMC20947]QCB46425.1 hypothetical protein E5678_10550 [Hydrogenophaga sp. PAMC20947]